MITTREMIAALNAADNPGMRPMMWTYKGFTLTARRVNGFDQTSVFDPRFKRDPSIYIATSPALAMQFVDAYRDGLAWAMNAAAEKLEQDAEDLRDKCRANLSGGW